MSELLNETIVQQGLVNEEKAEATEYEVKLKRLVRRLRDATKDYEEAIALFEKVNKIDDEVLEFISQYHGSEAAILNVPTTLLEATELLLNREKSLKFTIDLGAIGKNGSIVVSKCHGKWSYNRLWNVELKEK